MPEHAVTGDPQRGLRQIGAYKVTGEPNPNFEHANRGKRSVGLDVSTPEGQQIACELAGRSDVFLTNFLPAARQRFNLDVEDIRKANPAIIYARGSALGPRGVESNRGGYDMTAFWSRGTSAASITPPNSDGLISPPPAYGDTISGTNLAGGIAAALLKRERTGNDAQARANEYFLPAGSLELVSSPVQFDVAPPELGPAPGFAAQTEEILQEIGLDWDRILELKAIGAVT